MPRRLGLTLPKLAVVGSMILAGCGGTNHPQSRPSPEAHVPPIAPVALTAAGLGREAKQIGKPIYWAGPREGYSYEFRLTARGALYVRYLPKGAHAGDLGANYLIVATYPFSGAFDGLKKAANGKETAGPAGSVVYVRPNNPKSVLIAFPGVDYQIEVYDPRPSVALSAARSGNVQPVPSTS